MQPSPPCHHRHRLCCTQPFACSLTCIGRVGTRCRPRRHLTLKRRETRACTRRTCAAAGSRCWTCAPDAPLLPSSMAATALWCSSLRYVFGCKLHAFCLHEGGLRQAKKSKHHPRLPWVTKGGSELEYHVLQLKRAHVNIHTHSTSGTQVLHNHTSMSTTTQSKQGTQAHLARSTRGRAAMGVAGVCVKGHSH
eukprot:1150834-Pelagomonas_calceolata.AAC.3